MLGYPVLFRRVVIVPVLLGLLLQTCPGLWAAQPTWPGPLSPEHIKRLMERLDPEGRAALREALEKHDQVLARSTSDFVKQWAVGAGLGGFLGGGLALGMGAAVLPLTVGMALLGGFAVWRLAKAIHADQVSSARQELLHEVIRIAGSAGARASSTASSGPQTGDGSALSEQSGPSTLPEPTPTENRPPRSESPGGPDFEELPIRQPGE